MSTSAVSLPDQLEWIDKHEASRRLRLSPSRIAGLAASGKIQTKPGRNRRGQPTNLLHAGDVERCAFERDNPRAVLPPQKIENDPLVNVSIHALPDIVNHLIAMIPTVAAQFKPVQLPQWITVVVAAEYTSLPASTIETLIKSGKLPALDCGPRPGGKWRVKRTDLDALEGDR